MERLGDYRKILLTGMRTQENAPTMLGGCERICLPVSMGYATNYYKATFRKGGAATRQFSWDGYEQYSLKAGRLQGNFPLTRFIDEK